jgi:hypothetical protein
MNEKEKKLNKLRELAEILDSKKSGTTELVLLKKINELKDELGRLQELLGVIEGNATKKTDEVINNLNETYSALESKINDLSKQDIKLSKDTQYTQDYFKGELQTIKNTISNLKLQHGKDGRDGKDAEPIDTSTIALEASKRAVEAIKPLIPIVPTSDEIIAQIPVIGEKVRDSLELLQGEERLDAKAIKNLPKAIETGVKYYGGTGLIKGLRAGTNITIDNSIIDYPLISAAGGDEADTLQTVTDRGATTDNIITVPGVQIDTTATPATSAPGLMQWNTVDGTLDIGMLNGSVLQVGQENYVYGKASGAIANGDIVQEAGSQGDHILVKKAVPAEIIANPRLVIGVATQNIANGEYGYVTNFGKINDVYTTGWAEGDILYFDNSTGALTNTEPSAPERRITMGRVVKEATGASENGKIFIRIAFGFKLTDLDDVNGTALTTDGQIPTWHDTEGYFDFDKNINDYIRKDGTTVTTATIPFAYGLTANDGALTYFQYDDIRSTGEPEVTISGNYNSKLYIQSSGVEPNSQNGFVIGKVGAGDDFYIFNDASGHHIYNNTFGQYVYDISRTLMDLKLPLKLSNYTTNGFIKTSNSDGTISIDTNTYLTSGAADLLYLKLDASNDPLTGALTIEKTDAEAFLVRKDSDGGDVFTVDTTNERVLVGTPSSPTGLLYVNKLDDSTATGTVTNYGLYQYYTGNSQTITGGTFNLLTSYGGSFTNIVNQTYDSASQLGGFTVRGIQVNAQHNGKTIGTAPAFGSSQTLDGINLATTSRFDQGVNVSGTNTTRGISNFVNELTTVRSGGLTSTIDAINTSIALNASLIAPATGLTQTVAGERITINESATNQGSIIDSYGLYITISSARGSSPSRFNGIWIDSVTGGTTNRGIVLDQDGAGGDIWFGEDQDAYIRYDGTDLEIQPNAVGSGKIKLDTFTIPNTVAQGDLLYASSTTALSSLAKNTTATRYLSNTGTSNNPAWAQINLANGVTGTLGTGNGGTGQTSWTAGRVVFPTSATVLGGDAAFFWDNTVKNLSLNFTAAAQPATSRYTYYGNYVNNVAVSAAGDAVVHSNFYGTSSFGKTYTNTSALLASKYGFYSSVTAADIFTGTTGSSIFSKDITGIFSFIVNSEENRTTSSNAQTNYGIRASLSANQKQTTSVATATFNEYGILSSVTSNYTQTTGTINSNIYGISSVVSEAAGSTRSNQNIIGLNVDVSSNRAGSSLKGIVLPRDGAGGDIYMGAGNDFFLSYDGTDGYIQAITGKIKLIPVDGSSVEIGGGGAGIDYSLSFNGETNDGLITWMEDEDYFKYSDGILMDSTEEIFFRDTAIKINSIDDGHLDLTADVSIDLNATVDAGANTIQTTGSIKGVHKAADGTAAVADGTYSFYNDGTTSGQVTGMTIKDGVVTAISQIP